MISPERKAKLTWQCRRGMLELDLILNRFLRNKLDTMLEEQLKQFENLLNCSDPDLYSWLMDSMKPEDKELGEIVKFIKLHS